MPNPNDPKQPKNPMRRDDTERDRPGSDERDPQRMPRTDRPERREIDPEVPGTEDDMREPGGSSRGPDRERR